LQVQLHNCVDSNIAENQMPHVDCSCSHSIRIRAMSRQRGIPIVLGNDCCRNIQVFDLCPSRLTRTYTGRRDHEFFISEDFEFERGGDGETGGIVYEYKCSKGSI